MQKIQIQTAIDIGNVEFQDWMKLNYPSYENQIGFTKAMWKAWCQGYYANTKP